jgi:hypothetical protein
LVDIFKLVFHPRIEWENVRKISSFSCGRFLKGVIFFCAISPIALFVLDFLAGHFRRPYIGFTWSFFISYIVLLFLSFLLSVLLAFLSVLLIKSAAGFLSGEKSIQKSRMLVFYSFIPYWISGAFLYLAPIIGFFLMIAMSAYSFCLLYLGIKSKILQIPDKNIIKFFLLCSSGIVILMVVRELMILVLRIVI